MAIWTGTEQDRPSGRFVRNLALSLSGGALLTVLGAGAAQAQDGGAAGTASDGAGAAHSGDATAVGNRSGTTKNQSTGASGTLGNLQVVDQTAAVGNVGVAVANTGGNVATGNASTNTANTSQTAVSGLGPAVNSGTAANASNGTATVSTGDASAVGNQSTTAITQTSGTAAHGALGGILVVSQTGVVLNAGVAQANTGGNTATGNESDNTAGLVQTATTPLGLATNSGRAANASDGLATIHTGSASATGNQSDTKVTQTSSGDAGDDPGGALLITEAGAVINFGFATADTGGNTAIGNTAAVAANGLTQDAVQSPSVVALLPVTSNSGDLSTTSDGTGSIVTGAATATGNESTTDLTQSGEGEADGVVPITQAALVLNAGVALAGTGGNSAAGNGSSSNAVVTQRAGVGLTGSTVAGSAIASNSAEVSSSSDGTASIVTGDATATGNASHTAVDQTIDPNGLVLNPQLAVVANLGAAQATTGGNIARGNLSTNTMIPGQFSTVGGAGTVLAGQILSSNTLAASNSSDGSASIVTGDATASGNESSTQINQTNNASIGGLGLIVTPQVAVVANVGLGVANTGDNDADGNGSVNDQNASQTATVGASLPASSLVALSAIASNDATVANESDGSAEIGTGAATATGNASSTHLVQSNDATVDGLGAVIAPQIGGVLNAGVAVADSGRNGAGGNGSENDLAASQNAFTASSQAAVQNNVVAGPATASNTLDTTNASDGHAKVKTGRATAEGNRSTTTLVQSSRDTVEGLGLVVGPQIGGVANIGLAVADTGDNLALGNDSENTSPPAAQAAFLASDATPFSGIILGPATAANQMDASNLSDGEACVCTGDATASGNISTTTLLQDLDITVGTGLAVVTETGGVLNAGIGIASSGSNQAAGNVSDNTFVVTQTSRVNDALLGLPIVGPQTASNGATAASTSAGTALVASGNATAIGNESTTDFVQAATVDAGFALSNLVGGTANVGLGLATSGNNTATGNDSTNLATLTQVAEGAGVASNQGEATNDSDGTAIIGNPEDCEDEVTPPAEEPGLPRTGAELETQAAIGLMLLLLGFGLRRRGQRLA